jgi:hypothetical protein
MRASVHFERLGVWRMDCPSIDRESQRSESDPESFGKPMEVVMVIIAIFGGLFLGGAVLAMLKRVGEPAESRVKRLHIV